MHELLCAGWGNQAGSNHVLMTQLLWFSIWLSLCCELKGWGETTVELFVLSQGCTGTCSSLSAVLGSSWPHCFSQLVLLTFSTTSRQAQGWGRQLVQCVELGEALSASSVLPRHHRGGLTSKQIKPDLQCYRSSDSALQSAHWQEASVSLQRAKCVLLACPKWGGPECGGKTRSFCVGAAAALSRVSYR